MNDERVRPSGAVPRTLALTSGNRLPGGNAEDGSAPAAAVG